MSASEGSGAGRCAGSGAAERRGVDDPNRREWGRRAHGTARRLQIGSRSSKRRYDRIGLEMWAFERQPLVVERVDDGEARVVRGSVDHQSREDGQQGEEQDADGLRRRARGEAFLKYVNDVLGAKHKAIIVPECGHNDRCIYTTDLVFPVIFPR